MKRAFWVLLGLASACGDVDAAYQKYCQRFPDQEGCVTITPFDGGSGGGSAGGGGSATGGGGATGGGTTGGGGGSVTGGGGGTLDAGNDAGTDAGAADAGDAGPGDAGGLDAGDLDAGVDAGSDGGTIDAGYAGPPLTFWDLHVGRDQACARSMVDRPNPAGGTFSVGDVYCWGDYSVINNTQTLAAHFVSLPLADQLVVGGLSLCVSYAGQWACLAGPLHGRQGQAHGPDGGADEVSFGNGSNYQSEFGCAIRGGALDCWDSITPASFTADVVSVSSGSGIEWDTFGNCAANGASACALFADGGASCWGDNFGGKAGADAGLLSISATPLVVAQKVLSISSGGNSTCATLENHTATCWGPLAAGAAQLANVARVVAGGCHACAQLDDAGVRCWGENKGAQAGDSSVVPVTVPIAPVGLGQIQTIEAGGNLTCATVRDGSVWCWGLVYSRYGTGRLPIQVLR